jgi:formyl-CoA transferase
MRSDLVYCSITGFGQDGPYKDRGGYDFLIQGMSGLMSLTGFPDEAGGAPPKVGVPVADLFTGLYAAIAILAAIRHRQVTGQGQHIDCALFDSQLAVLVNQASNYLNGGVEPRRLGNEHPNVVPYQDFETADGRVLVALGNDRQFRALCALLGLDALAVDARFVDNAGRSVTRTELQAELGQAIARWRSADLLAAMEVAGLPGGPVNTVAQALDDPQAKARQVVRTLHRADGQPVDVIGFPAKLSRTPADYRLAPPRTGENTRAVLGNDLGLSADQLDDLTARGVIAEDKRS